MRGGEHWERAAHAAGIDADRRRWTKLRRLEPPQAACQQLEVRERDLARGEVARRLQSC